MTPDDLRARYDQGPMNALRIRAVVLSLLISVLDGYDALSISFAAPALSADWAIGKAVLGVILSASLAGMAVGALALAPVADTLGRKRVLLAGLAMMTVGSLMSAFAHDVGTLMAWRVLTGIGIGGCVAIIITMTAEFSNARTRPIALAVMSIGYPIGGLVGGLLSAWLLAHFTWRSVFLAGFVIGTLMLPILALLLPESLAYLIGRDRPGRHERINDLLRRSGLDPLTKPLPIAVQRRGYGGVFGPDQRPVTIRLAVVSAINTAAAYFFLSWLPQVVHIAGFSPSDASLVAAASSFAGVVGGLSFGVFARGHGQIRFAAGAILALGISMVVFGQIPPVISALVVAGGVCGFCLYAAATGFYAIIPQNFADANRASGTGFVMGVGRTSSAIAPTLAGALLAAGFSVGQVFGLFGAASIVAGTLLFFHRPPAFFPGAAIAASDAKT